MTPARASGEGDPAPRSDPPAEDVELILHVVEGYEAVDWPTAANLLAKHYRAQGAEWQGAYQRLEAELAELRGRYVVATTRWSAAQRENERLAALQENFERLVEIEERVDDILCRLRFPSWIGYRIAYWIKYGKFS